MPKLFHARSLLTLMLPRRGGLFFHRVYFISFI